MPGSERMGADRGAEQDALRTDAEDRVKGLMDALEQSVARAKEARDRKVMRDLLSGGCSQFADVEAHPGICCNCGNNPERCPTGVPERLLDA